MRSLLAILTVLFVTGCSASYHAKKAIKKNPLAFESDTTIVYKTVIVETPKVDTVFLSSIDTVEMVIDNVKIKHHYSQVTKEIFIEVDCPDVEIVTETKTITLPPIIIKPSFLDKLKSGLVLSLIIVVVVLIAKSVIKSVL